jgi:small-conductance mechanosensitive channel
MSKEKDKNTLSEKYIWDWVKLLGGAIKGPFWLFLSIVGVNILGRAIFNNFFLRYSIELNSILSTFINVVLIICIYWAFLRIIKILHVKLRLYLEKTNGKIAYFLLDFFVNVVKIILLLSLLSLIIDLLPIPKEYSYFSEKLVGILIIISIASILIKIVKVTETIILSKYKVDLSDELLAHKARTQIIILGRIAITLIVIISLGSMLLLFETVKNFGASILTSAGVLGVVSALAIQRPLRNLADSLQIIFNRLIKINDIVLIENELGTIEEINLYYVVIKIWDLRSLIVPINYFVEKPFINLSRTSKEILCIVKLYVDYTLPVNNLRKILNELVLHSSLWNHKVCKLEVTDAKEHTMELRVLLSARSPSDAWDLQCEIREKLIEHISQKHRAHLPILRTNFINHS